MKEKFSRREKIEIYFTLSRRFGWVCWYCGIPLTPPSWLFPKERKKRGVPREFSILNKLEIHIDHIVPKSRGGSDDIGNYALTCEFCNRAKLDLDLDVYLDWLNKIRFNIIWCPFRDGKEGYRG